MGSSTAAEATIKINFEPKYELIKEEDCDILCLHLLGFKKEELKVQVTSRDVLKLKISGTTSVKDNIFSSFVMDFPFSQNYDTNNITAIFDKGILQVRLPKILNAKNSTPGEITQHKDKQEISESAGRTKKDESSINQDDQHKDHEKDDELDPATKLKMDRKKMMMVVAVLYVIALGVLISKMQYWFSRIYHN